MEVFSAVLMERCVIIERGRLLHRETALGK
jgi:hypothetical protein